MQLFIDCDGVLADFEARARIILHEDVNVALRRDEESVWEILRRAEIFRHLQVREDGRKLFLAIRHLNPIILTGGVPAGRLGSAAESETGPRSAFTAFKSSRVHR